MKPIVTFIFILGNLIIPIITYGNEVVFYQIEIEHPKIGKPLIITKTTRLHHREEMITKYKYWPMSFTITAVADGKEYTVEHDAAWREYYDAFPTLDKTGYILVRKKESPECCQLLEITIYRYKKGSMTIDNPKGEKNFWSKDGKYLVTGSFPNPFYEKELALYFYDIEDGKIIKETEFKGPDEMSSYIDKNRVFWN